MKIKDGIYIEKEASFAIILEKYHAFQMAYEILKDYGGITNLSKELNPFWGQEIMYFDYKWNSYVILSATGSPCAANAVERAKRTGVKKIVSFGTCGSLSESINPGTFIISLAAVRDEGTTIGYLDLKVPSVADLKTSLDLKEALLSLNHTPLIGTTFTTDKRYKEKQDEFEQLFSSANVLNVDMETASLILVSRYHKIPIAAFNLVTDCAVTKTEGEFKGTYKGEEEYTDFIFTNLQVALSAALATLSNDN